MRGETFLNAANWRWLRITSAAVVAALVWYWLDNPVSQKSGSTQYGYTVGIISGLAMVFLLWYGSRKRRYFSEINTLREVLSAHVWIGLSLLILVPLHSGFEFHLNVHTLAFVLCVLTILTGIWGIYLYRALPKNIKSNRGEGSMRNLLEQFDNLAQALRRLEADKSDAFISFVNHLDTYSVAPLPSLIMGKRAQPISKELTARALQTIPEGERMDALAAISIIDKRYEFLVRVEKEALVQCWLKLWLVGHVPLAFASFLLLVIHVVSVLYYG